MTTPQTRPTRSAGFDLVVPAGWQRIRLQPSAVRAADVRSLVQHLFGERSEVAALRAETEAWLRRTTDASADQHGIATWLSTDTVGGFPLAMSLTATDLSPSRVAGFAEVVDQLHSASGVETATLRPGRTLRHTYRRGASDAARTPGLMPPEVAPERLGEVRLLVVDYWVERPDRRVLHLSFTSPLVDLAEPLTEMWDTIVDTVTWRESADNGRPA